MALLLPTKAKSKKRRTNTRVWFWVDECKYSVVVDNVKGLGWKIVDEERHEAKSNMYWVDVAAIHERFRSIQAWQTINHFPGMPNIARKNRMGQNLNRMLKMFPREYDFYPRTWVLPGELADFRAQFDNLGNSLGNKIFIIKPDTGCQGRGIFLTRTFDLVPQQENVVAQLYIKKPLLLDGYKFDLRIYCLVSSVKPLRMYLFHDGLVRMCTEEYVAPTRQNITNTCMHLTNYAVNKHNSNFQQPSAKSISGNQDEGSKRSVSWFMNYIRDLKGDSKADWLWNRIGTLCVRTVLSIIPTLSREYDQHFRSFGGVPYVLPTAVHERALYGGLQGSSSTSHHDKVFKTAVLRTEEQSSKGEGKNDDAEDSDDEDQSFQRVLSCVASSRSNGGEEAESRETLDPDSTGGGAVRVGVGGRHVEEQGEESGGREEDGDVASEGKGADESNPNKNSSDGSGSGSGESEVKMPSYRGSRCFEILGFDVMLDSKLSPWLIEVNHLPSFGTDSPLDLDIKERLMHQALRSLAVLPDDEQAYLHYHKVEAEKRLMSMSRREKDKEDVPVEMTKMRPVPFSTNRSMGAKNVAPAPATSRALGFHGLGHCALTPASASISSSEQRRESSGDADADVDLYIGMEKSRGTLLRAADVPEYVNIDGLAAASHSSNIPTEESSPQRVAEIRRTLLAIYAEFSPEKVPKIDRLLGKYAGREEEFLRFVREKYSIDAPASALGVHAAAITGALPSALSETRAVTADSSYFRNSDIGNRGDREIVRREQSITSTDVSTCSSAHSKSRSSSRSSSSSPSHSPRVRHGSYHDHEAAEDGSSSSNGNGKEIKSSLNYDAEADPGSAFDSLGDAERSPRNMTSSASRCAEPLPSSTSTSTSTGLLLSLDNPLLPNAQSQRTVGHRESRTAGGLYKGSGSGSQRGISPCSFGGRSVSPPPSRRAIWKSSADEDTAYRAEVLQCHVPTEQDEWMQFETRALKEFTRIFPPEKKAVDKAFTEECEVEEDEGDDEDDASAIPHPLAVEKPDALLPSKHLTVASTSSAPSSSSSSSAADVREPSASYEEIMYQVFLQDKRSTMRLHIPLPNRAIVKSDSSAETSTLPPLDHPNRPQIGTMAAQASKGLGWRAPAAKLPDTRDSLRNPTQTQLESANRLSQGLSVSMSYNMTKEAVSSGAGGSGSGGGLAPWMAGYGPHGTVYRQPISGAPASAIFDYEPPHDHEVHFGPQSYYQNQNQNYFQHQHVQHMQAGAGPGGIDGEAVWFKRSMNGRSSEEHSGRGGPGIGEGAGTGTGLGRLRSDIAKHGGMSQPYTPAAVLRQQVFSFDGRGAEGGSSSSASLSASASPPLSADHQGAHHTVTRGLTVGGNTQKYPALVRNRGAPSYDYTNSYSNTTANQSSSSSNSNSNIHNRR